MAITTSTSSSSPLPSLPLEIKAHILRLCNQQTLAQTSRVSLAFLQLSSPLLNNDIHISTPEGLGRLFLSRDEESAQPQLSPYLNLTSISTFTFNLTTPRPSILEHFNFSTSRLPSPSSQIHLQTLSLHLLPYPTVVPHHLWTHLLPLFDPVNVDITGSLLPECNSPFPYGVNLSPAVWSNLERIDLFGAPTDHGRMVLAGFLNAGKEEERRVTIVVDLIGKKDGKRLTKAEVRLYEKQRRILEMRGGLNGFEGTDFSALGSSRLKELVVRVASKKEEERMRSRLEEEWEKGTIEQSAREERRSRLRFEVV